LGHWLRLLGSARGGDFARAHHIGIAVERGGGLDMRGGTDDRTEAVL
jgi:hypothetical protein